MDLRKFSPFPDVFRSAISKLSEDFLSDLRVCSVQAENMAMLKEDRVEQCKQGRWYLEWLRPAAYDCWPNREPKLLREPKMYRVWLTEYQFTKGELRKDISTYPYNTLPHVCWNDLVKKYEQEKPNQARCASCGEVYLWRDLPKKWELASWQIAAPEDAGVTPHLGHHSLKRGQQTFRNSWYYFNGKPLSCSLCTVVSCSLCGQAFNWGDQFRRERCTCGGQVIVASRIGPQRPIVRCPDHTQCCRTDVYYIQGDICICSSCGKCMEGVSQDYYFAVHVRPGDVYCPCGGKVVPGARMHPHGCKPDTGPIYPFSGGYSRCLAEVFALRPKCPGTVFEMDWERRCSCCGQLETLTGLMYLSYDDPGETRYSRGWPTAYTHTIWLGGHFQDTDCPRKSSMPRSHFEYPLVLPGSPIQHVQHFLRGEKYELPWEYLRKVHRRQ